MNKKQISLLSLSFIINIVNAHAPIDMSRFQAAYEQTSEKTHSAWQREQVALGLLLTLTKEGKAYDEAFNRCAPTVTCGTDITYQQASAALKSTNYYQMIYSPILTYAYYQNAKEFGLEYILLDTQQIQAGYPAREFDIMRAALNKALHNNSELTAPTRKEDIEGRERAFNELTDLINAEEEKYHQQNKDSQK